MVAKRTVLFVCVGNAGRSMMAEAIFDQLCPDGWRAASAGVAPARATNPLTGPTLAEIGVSLPPHPPQRVTEPMVRDAALCVSLGALDHASCPAWFVRARPRPWAVPDPQYLDAQGFREIREAVRSRVEALIAGLRSQEPRDRA